VRNQWIIIGGPVRWTGKANSPLCKCISTREISSSVPFSLGALFQNNSNIHSSQQKTNHHITVKHWICVCNNFMEQASSWEDDSRSACQEIPHLLSFQKVHYCFHRIPPTVTILSHLNSVHILIPYFSKI